MGVRQLKSFIYSSVPNGVANVSIINECINFMRTFSTRPTLMIDLKALMRLVLKDNQEILCGGRHNVYILLYEQLFQRLSYCANIVFFEIADEPVLKQKMKDWYTQQDDQYQKSIQVLDAIYQGYSLQEIVTNLQEIPTSNTHLNAIKTVAKMYGNVYVTISKECDAEIARYATANGVLAILSDDSDFLIFSGPWMLFSLAHLDVNTLMTAKFDRVVLREYFNLSDMQLVALSTLNGNDVITMEDVEDFHRTSVGDSYQNPTIRIPKLVELIRKHLPPKQKDVIQAIIARHVFKPESARKVRESFNMYNTDLPPQEPNDLLLKLCRVKHYNFTFSVRNGFPKSFPLLYFDLRQYDFPIVHEATMKLYRKQIGIITQDVLQPSASYEIAAKISHEGRYQKYHIVPIIPPYVVPPLIELLMHDDYPQHETVRLQLLKWSISECRKFMRADMRHIPLYYIHDILTLSYLVAERFIDTLEADLILLSLKEVSTNPTPNVKPPTHLDPRAFRIAFLFSKFHMMIMHSLEAVGLSSLQKAFNFDGVLFHNLYLMYRNRIPPQLLVDIKDYRLYA